MYVYPLDVTYMGLAMYTFDNTRNLTRQFKAQLGHRKLVLSVFLLVSFVAHGPHSNLLKEDTIISILRVCLYTLCVRECRAATWDTLGKYYWILNVHPLLLVIAPLQLKVDVDDRPKRKKEWAIEESEPGSIAV